MTLFEGYERRIAQILPALDKVGISSLEEAERLCESKGLDIPRVIRGDLFACASGDGDSFLSVQRETVGDSVFQREHSMIAVSVLFKKADDP